MTKHKKRIGKRGSVWHQSAEEATLAQKPYYNGFACGHGVHGDLKYNRSKQKRAWKRQMKQEGAHYKGSFDFVRRKCCEYVAKHQRRYTERCWGEISYLLCLFALLKRTKVCR